MNQIIIKNNRTHVDMGFDDDKRNKPDSNHRISPDFSHSWTPKNEEDL